MHHPDDLITLFNHCFTDSHETQLAYGADDPLYQPAHPDHPYHMIYFAHGFFSSALHECAHWFIAGEARRKLTDFGYWYIPDGRNEQQQQLFQQVEVKPQAIEYLLSLAAGYQFHFSIDNLQGEPVDTTAFEQAVLKQVENYEQHGLPKRAQLFKEALVNFYR
jgi:elongation factor P hydroxylase